MLRSTGSDGILFILQFFFPFMSDYGSCAMENTKVGQDIENLSENHNLLI
jgi:hypothetical protein